MIPAAADVVVVTGLSGAGKSTALRTLADLGYYCVDNLPPPLVVDTVRVCEKGAVLPVALGLDVRVGAFLDQALPALETLARQTDRIAIAFIDAADDCLVRRYSETRRPHPMLARSSLLDGDDPSPGRHVMAVLDGVQLERERLSAIRSRADITIDTSHLSVHELRREVTVRFSPDRATRPRMLTRFVSFGFKYGVPLDADLVFDVRFLDNPHFVPALRDGTGCDAPVRDFVLQSADCETFMEHVLGLLSFALPRYEREGKSYLTVAVGCTGGRHRSVAIADALAERLSADEQLRIGVVHRDVARGDTASLVPAPRSAADGVDTLEATAHDAEDDGAGE